MKIKNIILIALAILLFESKLALASAGFAFTRIGALSNLAPILLSGLFIWIAFKLSNKKSLNKNIAFQQNEENQVKFHKIQLPESEKQKFAAILVKIQSAWSQQNIAELKKFTTPEMARHFLNSIQQNQNQNLQNKVEDLVVLSTSIIESWEEDNLQYAIVHLKWLALDYNIDTEKKVSDPLYISQGDMYNPKETSESWTFSREKNKKDWILSDITKNT